MKRVFAGKWIFIILPLFYLGLSIIFLGSIKQFYIGHFDPPYCYLMNGVNLASGYFRVGIVEHPGTPVEIFAAIVIFIKHLFIGDTILYQDVLLHPESYLYTCSVLLALSLSLITYLSGTLVFRHSGNMLLALLFQSVPLFFSDIIKMTVSLSAESILAITGIYFSAYLYSNTIGNDQSSRKSASNKNVIVFGIFTAFLFTTKIYCAPFILLGLFMVKGGKQRICYLISSGLFILLFLFPLYNQLRNWAGFIKSMIFHSGSYGQGSSGIINSTLYRGNILEILTTHYLFALVYIIAIVAFLATLLKMLKKREDTSRFIFPITGIVVFFTLYILIIAKQYKVIYPEPLTHTIAVFTKYYYFIPLISFFPFIIGVSYKIISPFISLEFFRIHKQKMFYVLFFIFLAWGGKQAYGACCGVSNEDVALDKTRSFLDKQKETPLILVSDGYKACPELALFFGVSYSGRWDSPKYCDFLKRNYPDTYLYTTWNDELIFWDHKIDISTVLSKNHQAMIYLSGMDSITDIITIKRICGEQTQNNKESFNKIYSSANRYESIYLVKADSLH